MWAATASTGAMLLWGVVQPVDRVQVAGSATARADRQLAGELGLRPGAKAAVSSWRTCIHRSLSLRRIASVTGLRLSPTIL